jgi:regulator of protease activity HflC (stomatin/prohibitin superfamily)
MYLLEATDLEQTIKMNVLCKDSLNFAFDVSVLVAVDRSNSDLVMSMFENISPANGNTISAQQIFDTYARSLVDQEARKIVSKYQTSEIVAKRSDIISEVQSAVTKAFDQSIVKVKRVTVNNLDFPAVITLAQEDRAKRQVEIETERAEQQKRLLQAENELKIAEMNYKVELVEAATIADANKIIGASISPEYLAWWQLKVFSAAASGPNTWGFIPYTDHASGASMVGESVSGKTIIDAELRERIETARREAAATGQPAAGKETPAEEEATHQPPAAP